MVGFQSLNCIQWCSQKEGENAIMHIFDFISMVYNYIMPITVLDSASTSEQSTFALIQL